MKNLYIWFFALILGLNSCSNLQIAIPTSPNVVIVEVTRIVQITTTPVPIETLTPSPTLEPADVSSTQTAKLIGTPIVADMECYWTATTQSDLNNCAVTRNDELEKQMATLINAIKGKRL